MSVLQTSNVTLPNEVSLAIMGKAHDNSVIATLSPADTISAWKDDKYNVFTGKSRAQVVAEGEAKGAYEQPITQKEGKRFTVQTTTRVSKQLQWADEADQLQILDAIQADQAAALGEALDYVGLHAVNPLDGSALTGYPYVTDADGGAQFVTAGTDELANLDKLVEALNGKDVRADITGVALSRTWANALRKLRTADNAARLFPEIPLNLNIQGNLEGIPAAVSNSVEGVYAATATKVEAIMGDFTQFKWRLAQPITAEIIPYGDPDGTGNDLAHYNQVAYRTEAVFSYAILDPSQFAVLKTK